MMLSAMKGHPIHLKGRESPLNEHPRRITPAPKPQALQAAGPGTNKVELAAATGMEWPPAPKSFSQGRQQPASTTASSTAGHLKPGLAQYLVALEAAPMTYLQELVPHAYPGLCCWALLRHTGDEDALGEEGEKPMGIDSPQQPPRGTHP